MPKEQVVIRGTHFEARSGDGKAFLVYSIGDGQSSIMGHADGEGAANAVVEAVDLAYARGLQRVFFVLDGHGGHHELDRLRASASQPLLPPGVVVVPKEAPVAE